MKPKREISYIDAHNKAVKHYQKASLFLLYAGVLGLFAAIIGVVQMATTQVEVLPGEFNWPSSGFALSLSLQIYLDSLLLAHLDQVLASFLIIILSLVFGSLFGFLGYFATRGRRIFLIIGLALYFLDFIFMFFFYHLNLGSVGFVWTNYAFSLALHVIVIGFAIAGLVFYYQVFDIEKKFKGDNAVNFKQEEKRETIANGK